VKAGAAHMLHSIADRIDPATAAQRAADAEQRAAVIAQRNLDLRWLMNDERGRRIMRALFARCRLNASTYHEKQCIRDRLEGARDVATELSAELLGVDPANWTKLFHEDPRWPRPAPAKDANNA
jgi:hypothetical protein